MFYSRKLNRDSGKVEVWECEWSNPQTSMSKKEFIRRVGEEDDIASTVDHSQFSAASAVCWAPGRTIGNIAVSSEEVFGCFEGTAGDDAILPCHIIPCGKFRNGAKRWYCKTHQNHWGTLGDIEALPESGEVRCSNHSVGMSYVVDPLLIDFNDSEEIGIWCSLPPALSSGKIVKRPPSIVVKSNTNSAPTEHRAVVCAYNQKSGLFASTDITQIQITPPAAFEFVRALELGVETDCVSCKRCGYPHLDLGSFARHPHSKHFCGNCGNDSVISAGKIISTPLRPLHDQYHRANEYVTSTEALDIDDYPGHHFDIWPSVPAIVLTAATPQEYGIHVRIYRDKERRFPIVDRVYGQVSLGGRKLGRGALWMAMIANTT